MVIQLWLRQFDKTSDLLAALEESTLLKKVGDAYLHGLDDHRFNQLLVQDSGSEMACFVGFKNRVPVFLFLAQISQRRASFWGRPVKFHYDSQLGAYDRISLLSQLKKKLVGLGLNRLRFVSDPCATKVFFEKRGRETNHYIGKIDLTADSETIYANIRKSNKSLINWGRRELQLTEVDSQNFSDEKLREFADFHAKVSGRRTRSWESWQFQGDLVTKGRAVMILGYLEHQLVSAVLSFYGRKEAFYGIAVNDRLLMAERRPMGHWPLFRLILRAKEDALERFCLGPVAEDSDDEKAKSIANFRRGYSQVIELESVWDIHVSGET